jgi:hypothetical protein
MCRVEVKLHAYSTSALERVGEPYVLTNVQRKDPITYQMGGCVKTRVGMDVGEKKVLSSAGIERGIRVCVARRLTATPSGISLLPCIVTGNETL